MIDRCRIRYFKAFKSRFLIPMSGEVFENAPTKILSVRSDN